MLANGVLVAAVDQLGHELLLFAAVGILVGGLDDLLVDLLYLVGRAWRKLTPRRDAVRLTPPHRFAIFVPAWDEGEVIGAMLDTALARLKGPDYRLYVGVYPNDPATQAAVSAIAARDERVRMVTCPRPGPTTKADCLNALWRALVADENADGARVDAIVLHDAEDVVHPAELPIMARALVNHQVVQLPVLPLLDRGSRLVSGHYCDEFAEAHGKSAMIRPWLGAGMPLAGTGCAIARPLIGAIARKRQGAPFDASSLTEDYELGLALSGAGARATLERVRDPADGSLVAVRAYFPATLDAAVRQKARWMTGIALSGWDRTGWAWSLNPLEHWMRLRDRRAPLATLVLAAAYGALVVGALGLALHRWTATTPPPVSATLGWLLAINAGLLAWRLSVRAAFTGHAYGVAEALWSVPRAIVGNVVSLLAARRALATYLMALAGRRPPWDKTAHRFPDLSAGAR